MLAWVFFIRFSGVTATLASAVSSMILFLTSASTPSSYDRSGSLCDPFGSLLTLSVLSCLSSSVARSGVVALACPPPPWSVLSCLLVLVLSWSFLVLSVSSRPVLSSLPCSFLSCLVRVVVLRITSEDAPRLCFSLTVFRSCFVRQLI